MFKRRIAVSGAWNWKPRHSAERRVYCILQGCIDQVDSLIYFDTDSKELQQWDNQIQSVCTQLNQIMDTYTSRTTVPAA